MRPSQTLQNQNFATCHLPHSTHRTPSIKNPTRSPLTDKRHDCRENDLFALNANHCDFSVERLFSFDYVGSHFPGW